MLHGQRFAVGIPPGGGPEVVAKPAHQVLEGLERDLDLEPSGVELDDLVGLQAQIGTDQDEGMGAVFDQHEAQLVSDRFPEEVYAENRQGLCLAVDTQGDGLKSLRLAGEQLAQHEFWAVLAGAARPTVGRHSPVGHHVTFGARDDVKQALTIVSTRRVGNLESGAHSEVGVQNRHAGHGQVAADGFQECAHQGDNRGLLLTIDNGRRLALQFTQGLRPFVDLGGNRSTEALVRGTHQHADDAEMVAEDPGRFPRVLGLLVEFLHAGHALGLLGDLDSVPNQHQRPATGAQRMGLRYQAQPVRQDPIELQRHGPEKRQERLVEFRTNLQPPNARRDPVVVQADDEPQHGHHEPPKRRLPCKLVPKRHQQGAEPSDHRAPPHGGGKQLPRRTRVCGGRALGLLQPERVGVG
ncbi:hypothetical protein KAJ77_04010, partial [bacterium]|nr:hypothetical protein [bacterium]